LNRFAILLEGIDFLVPNFIFFQVKNTVTHPAIGVGNGTRAHVHHAAGLKSVEKQVVKNPMKRIGRIIGVHQLLRSGKLMRGYVHINFHGVLGLLLPIAILAHQGLRNRKYG